MARDEVHHLRVDVLLDGEDSETRALPGSVPRDVCVVLVLELVEGGIVCREGSGQSRHSSEPYPRGRRSRGPSPYSFPRDRRGASGGGSNPRNSCSSRRCSRR